MLFSHNWINFESFGRFWFFLLIYGCNFVTPSSREGGDGEDGMIISLSKTNWKPQRAGWKQHGTKWILIVLNNFELGKGKRKRWWGKQAIWRAFLLPALASMYLNLIFISLASSCFIAQYSPSNKLFSKYTNWAFSDP